MTSRGAGPPPASQAPAPAQATRSRVVFVDVARALAVLLMIVGHSLNVLLAPVHQQGDAWNWFMFLRGLTSCTFLLLSGFAFTIASSRYWEAQIRPSRRLARRMRRFTFFVALGYALRWPVDRLEHFAFLTPDRWTYFLIVDVLQCIGVTLVLLQALVMMSRTPRRFAWASAAVAVAVGLATPAVWRIDWTSVVPVGVAAYLSPGTGSFFPLFPWAAFMFLGASLGHVYVTAWPSDPQAFGRRVLLPGGVIAIAAALVFARVPLSPFGPTDPWSTSPNFLALRAGSVLVGLAVLSHLTSLMQHLPRVVAALAQESLLVYFLHLVVLYGSAWNAGARDLLPAPFGPLVAVTGVAVMLVSMSLLAWGWNWMKRRQRWWAAACKIGVLVAFFLSIR